MTRLTICLFLLPVVGLALSRQANAQAGSAPPAARKPHRDHKPKHGGIFFMAENGQHHLEGVFERPATFRVYLYDVYTRPLSAARLKQASGTVLWGDSEQAPETPLTVSQDGQTLQSTLEEVKLPITLTLLLHLPGSPAGSKAELFTFPFSKYTEDGAAGHHGR